MIIHENVNQTLFPCCLISGQFRNILVGINVFLMFRNSKDANTWQMSARYSNPHDNNVACSGLKTVINYNLMILNDCEFFYMIE